MKQKEIYEFVQSTVVSLQRKVEEEDDTPTLSKNIKEYTRGQLYEAKYILENIEHIIFKD